MSSDGIERCENCGESGFIVDRTAMITNPHSAEKHGETFALCETCADAFDMGAGNL